ncbi:MAG: poly-gamma-glutamate system protein [Synergistota bacterium]|nr:poly-gamma-glutamate system protein [Synergistota bacterium]
MDSLDLQKYQEKINKLRYRTVLFLFLITLLMAVLWIKGGTSLSQDEQKLYYTVSAAESELWQFKGSLQKLDPDTDTFKTGLIGLEWSPLSTTLGDLSAKRTACDPRWSIVVSRWLDRLNVKKGDSVVLLSSSSFPGMILNVLAALESYGVDTHMVLSLGSSTWGANDPEMPWPAIASYLRTKGMLHIKEKFITLGGSGETGGGISEDGLSIMTKIANANKTPLIVKDNLQEMIGWKMQIINEVKPIAVINIGGGHAAMGSDDIVTGLDPGLHLSENKMAGNGVVGMSLAAGYPVIHILNIKQLSAANGIPYDSAPMPFLRAKNNEAYAVSGIVLFFLALYFFKRWDIMK